MQRGVRNPGQDADGLRKHNVTGDMPRKQTRLRYALRNTYESRVRRKREDATYRDHRDTSMRQGTLLRSVFVRRMERIRSKLVTAVVPNTVLFAIWENFVHIFVVHVGDVIWTWRSWPAPIGHARGHRLGHLRRRLCGVIIRLALHARVVVDEESKGGKISHLWQTMRQQLTFLPSAGIRR